jgi:hypothetical protein
MANKPLSGSSTHSGVPGVLGDSSQFDGVLGVTTADGHAGVAGACDSGNSNGVYGRSKNANGVIGFSSGNAVSGVAGVNDDGNGAGVYGRSARGTGVWGESKALDGVTGTTTAKEHAGVAGVNEVGGNGVYGRGTGNGVFGVHTGDDGGGVVGTSDKNDGVRGYSSSKDHSGVVGTNYAGGNGVLGQTETGVGVSGISGRNIGVFGKGGSLAGRFEGIVEVTGDIRLTGADCAEDFDVSGEVDPGTVVVLCEDGKIRSSDSAYDHRVAGVISGAGNYRPGMVLDRQEDLMRRKPLALIGKVFCKIEAQDGPIRVGDLLTTSSTPGYAMRVQDQNKAFGAILGKALAKFESGKGMIPILVTLQ